MRKIIISDIHGCYYEFLRLLSKVQYNYKTDALYLLGDYMDRGERSREVLEFVCKFLSKTEHVKIIGGNHDDMFLAWLDDRDYAASPYTNDKNGGMATILSFAPFYVKGENDDEVRAYIKDKFAEEVEFLRNLPFYIEDDQHIYVHAGIDPEKENWKETSNKDFRWIRNRFFDVPNPNQKTVVFGHTATAVLYGKERFDVWFSEGKIGIDGGTKFGGQLNALVIEDGTYTCYSEKTT